MHTSAHARTYTHAMYTYTEGKGRGLGGLKLMIKLELPLLGIFIIMCYRQRPQDTRATEHVMELFFFFS